jgi:protein-S-isoprenylcysteine O-methyltransferase Ste14
MSTVLKTFLATIIVPGIACLLVPYLILKGSGALLNQTIGVWQVIALFISIPGLCMIIWVSVSFVHIGKGTPIPIDPPKILVVQGLYRYTRNPMYVGAITILIAEVIYFSSVWLLIYTTILWILLHLFIVIVEDLS